MAFSRKSSDPDSIPGRRASSSSPSPAASRLSVASITGRRASLDSPRMSESTARSTTTQGSLTSTSRSTADVPSASSPSNGKAVSSSPQPRDFSTITRRFGVPSGPGNTGSQSTASPRQATSSITAAGRSKTTTSAGRALTTDTSFGASPRSPTTSRTREGSPAPRSSVSPASRSSSLLADSRRAASTSPVSRLKVSSPAEKTAMKPTTSTSARSSIAGRSTLSASSGKAAGGRDTLRAKQVLKPASKGASLDMDVEPDQIEDPEPEKITQAQLQAVTDENKELKRKLVAMEAMHAAEMADPANFTQWRMRLLKSQNLVLESKLATVSASINTAADLKAELLTTLLTFQQKVGELKAAERIPEPAKEEVPAEAPPAPASPSIRRSLTNSRSTPLSSPTSRSPSSIDRLATSASPRTPGVTSRTPTATTPTSRLATSKASSSSSRTTSTSSRIGTTGLTKTSPTTGRTVTSTTGRAVTSESATRSSPARSPSPNGTRSSLGRSTSRTTSPRSQIQPPQETPPEPPVPPPPPRPPPVPKVAVAVDWLDSLSQWSEAALHKLTNMPAELARKGSSTGATAGVGTNLFMKAGGESAQPLEDGTKPTGVDPTRQESLPMVDFVRVHELDVQLAELHPQMLRAAELLHSVVLPSLPAETTEAVLKDLQAVDSATHAAARSLGQLSSLAPGQCMLIGVASATSEKAAALLEESTKQQSDLVESLMESSGEAPGERGSRGEGAPGQAAAREGSTCSNSEVPLVEQVLADLPKYKEEADEKEASRQLQTLLESLKRLEAVWLNEKKALMDEMDFYRGCHAANATHVQVVVQGARDALKDVMDGALQNGAVATTRIYKEAAPALEEPASHSSPHLQGQQQAGNESGQTTVDAAVTAVMSPLEQAYKDRLKDLFDSLQVKRGAMYRQRSLSISGRRKSPSAKSTSFSGLLSPEKLSPASSMASQADSTIQK